VVSENLPNYKSILRVRAKLATRYFVRHKLKFDGHYAPSVIGSQPVNHFNLQSVLAARRNMLEGTLPELRLSGR